MTEPEAVLSASDHVLPMDKAQLVDGLDCQDALGHIELGDVLRERVILDQPRLPRVSARLIRRPRLDEALEILTWSSDLHLGGTP